MLSTYLGNAILNKVVNDTNFTVTTPYLSLHTAAPGLVGSNEVSGGSYARQSGSFAAAASKATDNDAVAEFAAMPTTIVTYVGLWDALTVGNFLWGGRLLGGTFTGADTGDLITATAHGLANSARVAFEGATLPGGITAGTVYYVISAATNTFQISITEGGAAVNLTSDGDGYFIRAKVVNSGDTFELPIGDVDLALT